MTTESSNSVLGAGSITLNVGRLPAKKKSKTNVDGPKLEPFLNQLRPKKATALKSKSVAAVVDKPAGILKKPKASSTSPWKTFKEANRKGKSGVQSFVKSEPKAKTLVKKKVKVKDTPEVIVPSEVSWKKKSVEVADVGGGEGEEVEEKSESESAGAEEWSNKSATQLGKRSSKARFSEKGSDLEKELVQSGHTKKEGSWAQRNSLFGNNPEVPNIPHRAVKPVKEAVFSSKSFEDMGLHPYMVKYLKESMGLTKMTKVQEKSIPVLLKNQDALVRSQTGSGKTLAFALPIIHKLQEIRPKITRSDGVLVLVVVPTRELALQVYEVFNKLVKSYTWIVPGYLVGGEKRKAEKARLRKGISVLIGTPGRLIDHVQHTKALSLDKVSWLVIDEADRLLDMGYEKDVSVLLDALCHRETKLLKPSYLNPEEEQEKEKPQVNRQTVLLSATLTQKVEKLAGLSLKNPVFVDACDETTTSSSHVPVFSSDMQSQIDTMVLPESLSQKYIVTPPKLKLVTLAAFILWKSKLTKQKKMLIFIATQDMADYYSELLSSMFSGTAEEESDGEDASPLSKTGVELFKLHGNMKQGERTEVFKTFRKSRFGVLLCTDVASRGLDLPEVDWVIQYTGPTSVSDYVHRVGRTARGGQSGSSIIFLTPNEVSFIEKLENCQIRLEEQKMEACLAHLLSVNPQGRNVQEEAAKLQSMFEAMVAEKKELYDLGCKAFASWSRFYASYPRNMRDAFSVKAIHQGHHAKSFALKDTPSAIVAYARKNNLNEERFGKKRPRERWVEREREKEEGRRVPGKSRLSEISEFDSGLEPVKKKKKYTERRAERQTDRQTDRQRHPHLRERSKRRGWKRRHTPSPLPPSPFPLPIPAPASPKNSISFIKARPSKCE